MSETIFIRGNCYSRAEVVAALEKAKMPQPGELVETRGGELRLVIGDPMLAHLDAAHGCLASDEVRITDGKDTWGMRTCNLTVVAPALR